MRRAKTLTLIALLSTWTACGWGADDDGDAGGGGDAGNAGAAGSAGTAGAGGTGGAGGSGGAGVGGASGAAGSSGTGGAGGAGGAGAGGSAGAGAGGAGAGGTGGAGSCDQPCGDGRECCGDHCVNLQNDPGHCGECGVVCDADLFCTGGQCVARPCATTCGSAEQCCGSACCGVDELCCDSQGPVSVAPQCMTPNEFGTCPTGCAPLCICADPQTPIATPTGERPIAELREGDLVYSIHGGELRAVPLLRVQRTPVIGHHVQRVTLETGRVLEISAGHPTTDGRLFGQLAADVALDGVMIRSIERVAYARDATYDILPDSDTAAYFAAGVLIGSTLARDARQVTQPTAPFAEPQRSLRTQ